MLIVCPSCLSAYRMPPEAIGAGATSVRCAQCSGVFSPAAAVPAPRLDRSLMASLRPTTPRDILPATRPVRSLPAPAQDVSPRRTGTGVMALLAVGLGLGMGAVAWRAQLMHLLPASAPLFSALGMTAAPSGLSLGSIETALADEGATRVLTLEGEITNARQTASDVPNLRIVVRDASEQAVYSWVTPSPRARIGPGETLPFRSRLVSPPPNGHDLVVSFADRTDGGAPAEVKAGR